MYLISEARPVPAGVRAPRREAPLIEPPERDATELMDRLYNEFHWKHGVRSYDPTFSQSDLSSATMLRAVAGATLRGQQEFSIYCYERNDKPIFDGLAINLIDKLLKEASGGSYGLSSHFPGRNLFGVRERVNPQSLNLIMERLADPHSWKIRTRNEDGHIIWELGLYFEQMGWKKLTLVAELSDLNSKVHIYEVKLQDGDKIPEFDGIELRLSKIILDQGRRNDLAKRYETTPVAPGLPADLRAGLKAALESIGIPNGTYSREGFSSGRFLGRTTETVLKNRTTTATHLKFFRCKCGAVKSVSLQSGRNKQNAVLNSFSFDQIVPWHDSFCGLLGGHAERSKAAGLEPISPSRVVSVDYSADYMEELA